MTSNSTANGLLFGLAIWTAIIPGRPKTPTVFFEDTAVCVEDAYFDLKAEVCRVLCTAYFDKTEPDARYICSFGDAVWKTLTDPEENVEVEIDPEALTVTVNGVTLHLPKNSLSTNALRELAAERSRAFQD